MSRTRRLIAAVAIALGLAGAVAGVTTVYHTHPHAAHVVADPGTVYHT